MTASDNNDTLEIEARAEIVIPEATCPICRTVNKILFKGDKIEIELQDICLHFNPAQTLAHRTMTGKSHLFFNKAPKNDKINEAE